MAEVLKFPADLSVGAFADRAEAVASPVAKGWAEATVGAYDPDVAEDHRRVRDAFQAAFLDLVAVEPNLPEGYGHVADLILELAPLAEQIVEEWNLMYDMLEQVAQMPIPHRVGGLVGPDGLPLY